MARLCSLATAATATRLTPCQLLLSLWACAAASAHDSDGDPGRIRCPLRASGAGGDLGIGSELFRMRFVLVILFALGWILLAPLWALLSWSGTVLPAVDWVLFLFPRRCARRCSFSVPNPSRRRSGVVVLAVFHAVEAAGRGSGSGGLDFGQFGRIGA